MINKKILIADSSPLYREGIKIVLINDQSKLEISEADSAYAVVEQVVSKAAWDLIILDEKLIQSGKYCPLKYLIQRVSTPVLILCNELSYKTLSEVRCLGINNAASKTDSLNNLCHGINRVLAGEKFISKLGGGESNQFTNNDSLKLKACFFALTPAQKIVMGYVMKGMMNKVIANELGVSVHTVKAHVSKILYRFKVNSRTQLIVVISRFFPLEGIEESLYKKSSL